MCAHLAVRADAQVRDPQSLIELEFALRNAISAQDRIIASADAGIDAKHKIVVDADFKMGVKVSYSDADHRLYRSIIQSWGHYGQYLLDPERRQTAWKEYQAAKAQVYRLHLLGERADMIARLKAVTRRAATLASEGHEGLAAEARIWLWVA